MVVPPTVSSPRLSLRYHGDQVGEIDRLAALGLGHLDAALLGDALGVHVIDRILDPALERALEEGDGQKLGVVIRQGALVGDVELLQRPVGESRRSGGQASRTAAGTACTTFISSGLTGAILTALLTNWLFSAAATCSAMMVPARSWASIVEAPRCGVTTTLSNSSSGLPIGGSFSKTSMAAPATLPDLSALTSADSLTMPPRAQLTMRTPFFIFGKGRLVDETCRLGALGKVDGDEVGLLV